MTTTGPTPAHLRPIGAPAHGPVASLAGRLEAVVLLAGALRPSELSRAIGRSLLDLPLGDRGTVLDQWASAVAQLGRAVGAHVPLRVVLDRESPAPHGPGRRGDPAIELERDAATFRGTGGVLRDLAVGLDDDALLLVVNGPCALREPLEAVAAALMHCHADVALTAGPDDQADALMLVACRALRGIRPIGFVDFKEQVLPGLCGQFSVRVVRQGSRATMPVRSLETYMAALRTLHRQARGERDSADPFAERWRATFALRESGAEVHGTARLHDAVVLAGARVDARALVVRSVICPGAHVRAGRAVVECVLAGPRRRASAVEWISPPPATGIAEPATASRAPIRRAG